MIPSLNNSYRSLPSIVFQRIDPVAVKSPRLIVLNDELGKDLGLVPNDKEKAELTAWLSGNERWPGSEPIALAYAGHQFGGFSPQLGDGRAHLLGELTGKDGILYDVQLKGSGPTPYSRGGDGRAALGPVLREFLVSEAMHVLGVPTTRALAAVATGETVFRESPLPGAVLTRIAKSHLRVGTFEFLAARGEQTVLAELVNYTLARLYPDADESLPPALRLLDCVIERQAELIAQWMGLGFIHGVMNTDNCAISGQTIDYGPCAFMDTFDPHRKFSSIDRGGRYAYSQQAKIAQWNLARLAESLLALIDDDEAKAAARATDLLHQFPARYDRYFGEMCARKLGLSEDNDQAALLVTELFTRMNNAQADFTLTFRRVYDFALTSDSAALESILGNKPEALEWAEKFQQAFTENSASRHKRLETMKSANPLFIPRNHRVEEVIAAAMEGDEAPFFRLHKVLQNPCDDQEGMQDLAEPPGDEQWAYRTFCGT